MDLYEKGRIVSTSEDVGEGGAGRHYQKETIGDSTMPLRGIVLSPSKRPIEYVIMLSSSLFTIPI